VVGRAEAEEGAETVGMEPPELVIGAQFLLHERGYSDNPSVAGTDKSVMWRFCALTWVPQVTVLTEMDTGGDILESVPR
jgi:hypothetical protein